MWKIKASIPRISLLPVKKIHVGRHKNKQQSLVSWKLIEEKSFRVMIISAPCCYQFGRKSSDSA